MTLQSPVLPQFGGRLFLTDGGMETTLIFHEGVMLPQFAAFVLLGSESGRATLRSYYRRYLDIAAAHGAGFVLEAPTWRANRDWGASLGYDESALAGFNRAAIELLQEIRDEYSTAGIPLVISGNIGPRGDGYVAGNRMTAQEAEDYHGVQVRTLADAGADIVTAMTMTYAAEATGIVRSAALAGRPAVIGFTTETDGRLPDGSTLRSAIETVDREADGGPAYFMINCAHPDHFSATLESDASWCRRIGGIRANASRQSHAELDEAEELDDGDPGEFARLYRQLRDRLPNLAVVGGCCGTDHRHVEAVARAVA